MRIGAVIAALLVTAACSGRFFRPYEYEEELRLSLDGSAVMYVNASLAALNALRGTAFDTAPGAAFDAAAVRAYFDTPQSRVTRVTQSRRRGRRFAHIQLEIPDLRRLPEAPPFAWSRYDMAEREGLIRFHQDVGGPPAAAVPDPAWDGSELVAFRMRPPSKIQFHNAGPENLRRGNTLVWEQPLTARLRGVPLQLEARIETQSILYRTLWLFAATVAAVAVFFAVIVVLVRGRGASPVGAEPSGARRS